MSLTSAVVLVQVPFSAVRGRSSVFCVDLSEVSETVMRGTVQMFTKHVSDFSMSLCSVGPPANLFVRRQSDFDCETFMLGQRKSHLRF
ncbi:hypothetical protein FKM82_004361 [Ascaphus truei]